MDDQNNTTQSVDDIEQEIREHTDGNHARLKAHLMWWVGWWKRNIRGEETHYSLDDVEPIEREPPDYSVLIGRGAWYAQALHFFGLFIALVQVVMVTDALLPIGVDPTITAANGLFAGLGLAMVFASKVLGE